MRLYLRFRMIRTGSWLHELLFRSARRGFPCPLHMHAGLGCDVSGLSIRLSENIPDLESCYLHDMVLHSDGHSSALWTTFGPKWCGNLWKWSMAVGPALSQECYRRIAMRLKVATFRAVGGTDVRVVRTRATPSCRRSRRSDGLATTIRRRHQWLVKDSAELHNSL